MCDSFERHLWLGRWHEYVAADLADLLAYDREDDAEQEIMGQRLSAAQDAILGSPATTLIGAAVQLALWRYETASATWENGDQVLVDVMPVIMVHAGFPADMGQREWESNRSIRDAAYQQTEALSLLGD